MGHKWCEQALRTVMADDDEFVQPLGVGKLRDRGHAAVAAVEHLFQVHLGHALGGFLGVVVALSVDHQRAQHLAQLGLHLGLEFFHLAGLDEFGDVVVGMEAPVGRDQAVADTLGRAHRAEFFLGAEDPGRSVNPAAGLVGHRRLLAGDVT
jgi:hypothetical protein